MGCPDRRIDRLCITCCSPSSFFNPTGNTSVFAKVDVTFGEDIDGVGGKAGMRVAW
jgi:hypothetical protein